MAIEPSPGCSPAPGRKPRKRRAAQVLLACIALLAVGARLLFTQLGGASSMRALSEPRSLSSEASDLLSLVYRDLDPARIFDHHTHLVGIGAATDCWVNPRMKSWAHPKEHLRFLIYRSAAGIAQDDSADRDFIDVLSGLVKAQPFPSRQLLLAFDWRYGPSTGVSQDAGTSSSGYRIDREHSEFHVPNDYLFDVVAEYPEIFVPCVSIHPYRADAVDVLEACFARGARIVKWLPNAMGIDPADSRCDAFYSACARLGVTILTHTGEEQAVEAEADQELGNPLRLRRALDAGVRVLCAHCGSLGQSEDLDSEGAPPGQSFEFFLRLMGEERYNGLLFGEISAVLQINRFPIALATLLERTDLHERLVYGSDWPLPAVNVVISTRSLEQAGFLADGEREVLNEIYDYNPLLFSLAAARRVRHPRSGLRFPASVFQSRPELGLD